MLKKILMFLSVLFPHMHPNKLFINFGEYKKKGMKFSFSISLFKDRENFDTNKNQFYHNFSAT